MSRYLDFHPDLLDLARVKPCRSLQCDEIVRPETDMTVEGVSGFCRSCYVRLVAAR